MKRGYQTIKQRLAQGDTIFGPWCVVPSGYMMNLAASAGFDFVIIDMEHGPASYETAESMIRDAQAVGCSPVVRLGSVHEENVLKALDIGADGVIMAHVECRADAERAVFCSRYHPEGGRGFSPFTRAGGYDGGDIAEHARIQNETVLTGVILEGKSGIDSLEEIVKVPGIDLIYIGAYDLSQALGIPGQVGDPRVRKALEECVAVIREAGIGAGGFVARTRADMEWMIGTGMQFITYLPDCAVYRQAMSAAVQEFNQVCRKGEK